MKTLTSFENGAKRKRISVDSEKRRLSKTLTSFIYLSDAQMTIVAFSSDVFGGGKRYENDSVDGYVFGKNGAGAGAENGAKRKRISGDGASVALS